ncbi:hypothetical protein NFIA_095430 [Paecilomyces variotii No. 5]|uniref:Uncharacterized protein n=1 Tax=Byssochlamys spectabilis (strain No. 5 / NBRC 109023) TaxID=1356009 RepID=V5FRJ8_BYSSN|nr:hypothetical protein NFIA_095430 [Paecilomyces variotii No. 5]
MDRLPRVQKARLHEVADSLLEIYQTLAKMRFIDPGGIQKGPHDMKHLLPLYEELGLDPSIIYLYSILPYVDTALAGNSDFFHGGEFVDFRNHDDVKRGRDPFLVGPYGDDFEAEGGPYIRPWVTPLSQLGNHQSVIIYDAREHRIWIIDQEGWSSTDPALRGVPDGQREGVNANSIEHIPSRPAGHVLRDINRWYLSLIELPGGGDNSGLEWSTRSLDLEALYRTHGWPDNFDGEAFEMAQAREYAAYRAKYFAERPLREVNTYRGWSRPTKRMVRMHREKVNIALTTDEEWTARYDLLKAEKLKKRNEDDLKKAQEVADRMCPGGVCQRTEELPLWEAEMLRDESKGKLESAEAHRNWAEEFKDSDPERARYFRVQHHHKEKKARICRMAYEAAKADAERLCPGKSFASATGIKSLGQQDTKTRVQFHRDAVISIERDIQELREWAAQLPEEAMNARERVERDIQVQERALKDMRHMQKTAERWLEKQGNTE